MPFWRLYYHLVWSTKKREHLIQPEIEERLYAYIVRKAGELGVHVYAINGWYDHIHLVVSIPPRHAVADVVKRLKGASSHELNQADGLGGAFAWQRGYGALSMGERQRPIAIEYVQNQKQHHRQQTVVSWLEREAELEEGPENLVSAPDPPGPQVHEMAAVYEIGEISPFYSASDNETDSSTNDLQRQVSESLSERNYSGHGRFLPQRPQRTQRILGFLCALCALCG